MNMRVRILQSVLASALCLTLAPGMVMANNGKSGNGNSSHASDKSKGTSNSQAADHSKSGADTHGQPAGGNQDSGKSQGSTASELKGLNSSHANPTALVHANADSAVGKNAAYVAAVQVSATAAQDMADSTQAEIDAQANLAAAQAELQAAIDGGLDTTDAQARVDAATAAAVAAADALAAAQAAYDAATAAEQNALLLASGGHELSPEALAQYRANLGL